MNTDGIHSAEDIITAMNNSGKIYKKRGDNFAESLNAQSPEVNKFVISKLNELIHSGQPVTKKQVRDLEAQTKQQFGLKKFDISGKFSGDGKFADTLTGMQKNAQQPAQQLTQQNTVTGNQVGNTNKDVAAAKPGDWIIRKSGERIVLKQSDIDWAKKVIAKKNATTDANLAGKAADPKIDAESRKRTYQSLANAGQVNLAGKAADPKTDAESRKSLITDVKNSRDYALVNRLQTTPLAADSLQVGK